MAKSPAPKAAEPAVLPDATPPEADPAPVPDRFVQPLDHWCADLSATDRRVELIAAFHHEEVAAGRRMDSPDAYAARFAAMATRPV